MQTCMALRSAARPLPVAGRVQRPLVAPSMPLLKPGTMGCSTLCRAAPSKDPKDAGYESESDAAYNTAAEYCNINKAKRTLGEMEQDFLAAMASWYYEGKPTMTDEEFALLKEELIWSGSTVAVLTSDEQRFLEASQAYAKGKPIMSDEEFDVLKGELRTKGSTITAQGPRCSIRSKKMYADATPDYLRMTALNVPSVLAVLGLLFALDYETGFGVTKLIELPAPYGVVLLWGLLLPALFVVAYSLTQIGFKDNYILKAPCPNCGAENFTYFGDVLVVPGNRGQNTLECVSCKADLTFDEYKRIVVVAETSEAKQEKIAALAAKKAASAAKKAAKAAAAK